METERLMRAKGLAPDEARRQALAAFGGVEKHKEALRDGRGLAWLSGLSLDLKLGARMLAKYPGLTLAGGLALAMAIGIGAGWFDLIGDQFVDPSLPLDEGDRIVGVETGTRWRAQARAATAHDFVTWRRDAAHRCEDLGAYRTLDRNLITGDGRPEPVTVAAMTRVGIPGGSRAAAAGPTAARGRRRTRRAAGDRDRLRRVAAAVRRTGGRHRPDGAAGRTVATVVGVMPEGFAFPVNHRLWVPLRLGHPATGRSRAQRSACSAGSRREPRRHRRTLRSPTLVQRVAAASPQTHAHLRPRVLAYGGESPGDRSALEFAGGPNCRFCSS